MHHDIRFSKIRTDGVLLPKCVALITSAAVLQALGFLFRIAILRRLGNETMALYQLVMNAYAVMMALALQGILLTVSRKTASLLAIHRGDQLFALRRQARFLFLSLFACAVVPTLFFPDFIAGNLLGDIRTKPALLLLLLCILLTGFENINKSVFLGAQLVRPANISEIGELSLRILGVLLFGTIFKPADPRMGAMVVLLAMIASECFSVLFLNTIFRRKFRKPDKPTPKSFARKLRTELQKESIPVSLSALSNKILFSLVHVLIPILLVRQGFSRTDALSDYAVLFSMSYPLVTLPSCMIIPIGSIVLPKISHDIACNNRADCLRKSAKFLQLVGVCAIPFLLFISVFARPCCQLLYADASAAVYIPWLALATLPEYYEITAGNLLNGLGKTVSAATSILIEGGILLLLTLFLIPRFGLVGFCYARIISITLATGLNFYVLFRTIPLKFRFFNWVGRPLCAAAFSLAVCLLCFRAFGFMPLPIRFLLTLVLFFLLYGFFLSCLGTKWFQYFSTHFWADADDSKRPEKHPNPKQN